VPVAAILGMREVIANEYLLERGALWKVDDGIGGTFTLPANTAWFERPAHVPRIPRLGEHSHAVMKDQLGLTPGEIARLEDAGAFGSPQARAASTDKARRKVAAELD